MDLSCLALLKVRTPVVVRSNNSDDHMHYPLWTCRVRNTVSYVYMISHSFQYRFWSDVSLEGGEDSVDVRMHSSFIHVRQILGSPRGFVWGNMHGLMAFYG